MSLTCSSSIGESAAYGGLNSAVGGITTIVLAIIGASGAKPEVLMSISIRVATQFITEASEVELRRCFNKSPKMLSNRWPRTETGAAPAH
jgi:hypothetical protein